MTSFLFCGMFIDPEVVLWPFRALCYALPLRWSLEAFMCAVFHGHARFP